MGAYLWYDDAIKAPELYRVFVYGPNGGARFVNGAWQNLNPLYT